MQLPAHREDPGVRYVAGSFVVGVFLPSIAGGITFPLLSRLELVLGLSPAVVGLILSTADGVRLLSTAPIGSLLDRVGTRQPLIAGFLMLTVAPFGYALGMETGPVPLDPAIVFIGAAAVAGLGSALILVGGYAMITDVTTPENRGRWLGYMLGSYGLGFPVGLVGGGVVADTYGIRNAFLLAGVVTLLDPDRPRARSRLFTGSRSRRGTSPDPRSRPGGSSPGRPGSGQRNPKFSLSGLPDDGRSVHRQTRG